MHSATRLDDLKILECFLQNSLHAHLGRIVPFQVQCLYKDETLWVLAQHPTDVAIDIPETFSVLERALQAEEPKLHSQSDCIYAQKVISVHTPNKALQCTRW